ncbi:MAG: type III pantothenate kinase [Eubacterium sp.]|jgi:type III pantothenate kinase|nr:type III pantothenate kinase [Eubacterium sp.]
MLFTADVGNTNTVLSIFDKEKIIFQTRTATNRGLMADQYAITTLDLLRLYGINPTEVNGCIISSVVPPVTGELKIALERLFTLSVMVVGPGLKTGLNIKTDDPQSLGTDISCAAVAAKNIYPLPCIFIDLGTVTKIMALDKYGALVGGAFFPGIKISIEALTKSTATLPLIAPEKTERVIGHNSVECIRSGILYGTAAMIDGVLYKMSEELGESCSVAATGGFAPLIKDYCRTDITVHPYLVSEGLRLIYNRNVT